MNNKPANHFTVAVLAERGANGEVAVKFVDPESRMVLSPHEVAAKIQASAQSTDQISAQSAKVQMLVTSVDQRAALPSKTQTNVSRHGLDPRFAHSGPSKPAGQRNDSPLSAASGHRP